MKTITNAMLLIAVLFFGTITSAQEYFGTTTFGDTFIEIPYHSAMDSQGNVYAAGIYSGTMTVGSTTVTYAGGNADGFLTKHDNEGNPLWVKSFGGPLDDVALDVAVDADDNLYITGYFQGAGSNAFDADPGPGVYLLEQLSPFLSRDCFIIKLDSNGDFVWAKQVSNPAGAGANEDSKTIEVDSEGNVYVGGSFVYADFNPDPLEEEILFSTGGGASADGFLLKLDTDGDFVWVKTFPSTGNVQVEAMDLDDNGDLLIAGRYRNTVDLDPGAGTEEFTSNGGDDIFMVKLTSDGDYIWGQAFGGSGLDVIKSVKNLDSGIYLTGMFSGTVDLDPTSGENIVTSNGPWDAFLSKFDTDGNYVFSYTLGGEASDMEDVYNITTGPNGNLFAAGSFNGTTNFDNGMGEAFTTSNGKSDNFLMEITVEGEYVNHWTIGGENTEGYAQVYFNDNNEILTLGTFRSGTVDFNPFSGEDIIATTGNYDGYFSRYNIFNNANDDCSNAIAVSCGESVIGETMTDTDSGGNPANDEFYSFTGTGNAELITVSLCSGTDFDTVIRIFEDCTLANEIAMNDDFCDTQSEVTFISDGTSTYFIMIEGSGTENGNFTMNVSCGPVPPPNDMIANAIDVDEIGFPYLDPAVEMPAATTENGNPINCDLTDLNGVWYKFTTNVDGNADVAIATPAGESVVTFYTADNENATETDLTLVDQNSNPCGSGVSASITTLSNQTYYVFVMNSGSITDITIDATVLGIDNSPLNDFSFYPNPTSEKINLKATFTIDSAVIYNVMGQKVLEMNNGGNTMQLNVSTLTTGTYIMKVYINGTVGTYKLIKN